MGPGLARSNSHSPPASKPACQGPSGVTSGVYCDEDLRGGTGWPDGENMSRGLALGLQDFGGLGWMAEATRAQDGGMAIGQANAPRELSDKDAIERSKRGDAAAYKVLVERYQGRAYRLALRVLRDDELARDACQEAFLKAYLNLKRFEGRSSFYTWLYRLVMNLCLDFKRRDRSNRYVDVPEPADLERIAGSERASHEAEDWQSHTEAPDAALERRELRAAMGRAIDQLPASSRETLVLREVEGLSYAEIAQVLEIPKGTVMSRLHYARRRVQELLREGEGVDLEEVALAADPVAGGSDERR